MYKILQIQPKSNMMWPIKHNKRYYCVGDDGIQRSDSNDGEIVSD